MNKGQSFTFQQLKIEIPSLTARKEMEVENQGSSMLTNSKA